MGIKLRSSKLKYSFTMMDALFVIESGEVVLTDQCTKVGCQVQNLMTACLWCAHTADGCKLR